MVGVRREILLVRRGAVKLLYGLSVLGEEKGRVRYLSLRLADVPILKIRQLLLPLVDGREDLRRGRAGQLLIVGWQVIGRMGGERFVVLTGYWIRFDEIDLSNRAWHLLLERPTWTAIEVARMLMLQLQFVSMLLTVQRGHPRRGRVVITWRTVFRNGSIYLRGMSINYAPSGLSNLETSSRG